MQKFEKMKIAKNGETRFTYIGKSNEKISKKLEFIVSRSNIKHKIIIKAVLWDEAHFDIEATLIVKTGAKNSNTYLKIVCLLMSNKSSARVIPGLEITEDAVKSGHGATVSSVNKTQIEYLISRGLSQKQAEELIVEGFLK